MKASELNAMTDEQLVFRRLDLERVLFAATLRHRLGQLENTSVLGKTRRDIARVLTVLTAREQAAGENPGAIVARYRGAYVPSAPAAKSSDDAGAGFLKGILDGQGATE